MTILGYDGCTPLRNPYWGKVTGTIGNVAQRERQANLADRTRGRAATSGTRSRSPALNLNVPMDSPALTAALCGTSPCTSGPHKVVTLQLPDAAHCGRLLLAVPGSLRRWFPRRIWRSHADDRVHDRQHAGGGLMAAEADAPRPPDATGDRRNHGLRIFLIWLTAGRGRRPAHLVRPGPAPAAGRDVVVRLRPAVRHQGDGRDGRAGHAVRTDLLRLRADRLAAAGRRRGGRAAALHGNSRIQASWITSQPSSCWPCSSSARSSWSSRTAQARARARARSGSRAAPRCRCRSSASSGSFTYRYPQFGGFETTQLVLPAGQWVQFNVTSLDVIHSFWAYQLGVKADANPGVNNVAFTKPNHTGAITVRCAELCGLWHGAMFDYGRVVSVAPSGHGPPRPARSSWPT